MAFEKRVCRAIRHSWFVGLLGMALLSGCGQKPQKPELPRVTLAFQEWVGYGPFYLAKDKGFDGEEGFNLVLVDEQLDSARAEAFFSGMLGAEAATLDLLVSKTAQGVPITGVMAIDLSYGSDAIVAGDGIKTLEDLAGKKVAFARDDVSETFISSLFYKKGLPFDRMSIVSVRPEEAARTFLNKEADACVTWEPQVSQALKRPGSQTPN